MRRGLELLAVREPQQFLQHGMIGLQSDYQEASHHGVLPASL